jgi:hypothetical protein
LLNEPIGAFVGCVGIIFALMYTSVYNDSQNRQSEVSPPSHSLSLSHCVVNTVSCFCLTGTLCIALCICQIRNALAQEAGGVHTAMLLVRTLDADDNVNKTRALLLFSSYIENLATEIFFKSRTHPGSVMASSIEALCKPSQSHFVLRLIPA